MKTESNIIFVCGGAFVVFVLSTISLLTSSCEQLNQYPAAKTILTTAASVAIANAAKDDPQLASQASNLAANLAANTDDETSQVLAETITAGLNQAAADASTANPDASSK